MRCQANDVRNLEAVMAWVSLNDQYPLMEVSWKRKETEVQMMQQAVHPMFSFKLCISLFLFKGRKGMAG